MRWVSLAVVLAAGPCLAQDAATPGAPGAEAAVVAYVEAFAAGRHVEAAQALDPGELAEFVGLLQTLSAQGGAAPFDVDPKLAPPKAFAQFLAAVAEAQPELGEAYGSLEADVLGSVAEGDSLRHVVVRSRFTLAGAPTSGVQTTTARWDGARWVITFDDRMRQFRQTLEAMTGAAGSE